MNDRIGYYINVKEYLGDDLDGYPLYAGDDQDGADVRFEQECKLYSNRHGALTVLVELICKSEKGEHETQHRLISGTSADKVADFEPHPYPPNNRADSAGTDSGSVVNRYGTTPKRPKDNGEPRQ